MAFTILGEARMAPRIGLDVDVLVRTRLLAQRSVVALRALAKHHPTCCRAGWLMGSRTTWAMAISETDLAIPAG